MKEMKNKKADTSVPIHDLLAHRWSPRALDPEAEVSVDQLRALLEAARWAPSCGNTQPSRYIVGRRGDQTYKRILSTLTESNQAWAHRAGALLVGCAVTRNEKGAVPMAEYGVGLATENLVLQAVSEGLAARQMAGFDAEAMRREFSLPDDVLPLVVIAVGVATDASIFTDERDIAREGAPRERITLSDLAFTDEWGNSAFPE